MKFTKTLKGPKEPKKTPEEEYTAQIASLKETELRDLHKDLKIEHYGNSAAAVINAAAGVGFLSMRSTTRRYRTERMQIGVMEARMKEMEWEPLPTRYRDAVPIALEVAAGTTNGMTMGLVNVEKSARWTKDYVKRKDLFKTKEVIESEEEDVAEQVNTADENEKIEVPREVVVAELAGNSPQPSETMTEYKIARKPVPTAVKAEADNASLQQGENGMERKPVPTFTEAKADDESCQQEKSTVVVEETAIQHRDILNSPTELEVSEVKVPFEGSVQETVFKATKKDALKTRISGMNKKMRAYKTKNGKEENQTIISITEIPVDA